MFDRTCETCGKSFKSQRKDSTSCYGCALERITGGHPPEEGDFNTARITSGEMSDAVARELQEELESVDHAGEDRFQQGWSDDYWDEEDRDE